MQIVNFKSHRRKLDPEVDNMAPRWSNVKANRQFERWPVEKTAKDGRPATATGQRGFKGGNDGRPGQKAILNTR